MGDTASPARTRVAIFISGRGSNMAALLYAAALPDAAYEVVLVAANDPEAEGLALASASDGREVPQLVRRADDHEPT